MEYERNLRDYVLRTFQKRKWIVILMPILAGLLGVFFTQKPPTVFEATGRIRVVSRSQPLDLMMQTFYYYEEGNRLDTHAEVMLSREVLKEVAVTLGRLINEEDGTPLTDDQIAANAGDLDFISSLRDSIVATVVEGTSILLVTVRRPNREDAILYLNALLDTYAKRNEYEVNQNVIEGLNFLRDRLRQVEADLEASQTVLVDFMLANAERLSLGTDEISQTHRDLRLAKANVAALDGAILVLDKASAGDFAPRLDMLSSLTNSPEIAQSYALLRDLDGELRTLLSYQTPESPEVVAVAEQLRGMVAGFRTTFASERAALIAERDALQAKFLAMPANDAELERLRAEVDLNADMYAQVRSQHEAAALSDSQKTQEIQIIERAIDAVPVTESRRASRGLIAASIGLLLGVVIALLVETLDTSIGAIEDVEALLNVPVIGIIPPIDFDDIRTIIRSTMPQMLENPDINHFSSLVTHYDPRSPVAEAYRALRTNIEKARAAADAKIIMVTSSVLEEGKTTTAANLALSFAQMGHKTMLLAADLRHPDIHRVFGLQKEPGLADVLTASMPWESATRGLSDILLGELPMDIVMLTPGMDNLHLLPSGSNPLNPAELLSSKSMRDLLDELRDAFDIIIIDTPPIIPVTDSAVLAEHTDGVVLIYEVGKVGRDVLKRAKSHFDNVNADIWGVVMNDVRAEAETALRDTDHHYRYEEGATGPPTGVLGSLGRPASKILGRRT
ncbi:MAG: polysaccharide biosynthesis tyrosine autokinase [Acidobacteria bacterium]|nr:polysaccharide biosynthesis tyrosine autokinase [Acidobacteriota bacterium]